MSEQEAIERLRAQPARADFCAAIDLLSRVHGGEVGAELPGDETPSFASDYSLDYQGGEILAVEAPPPNQPRAKTRVHTQVLGFGGSEGPLPLEMRVELARDNEDAALQRAFLDTFTHRFTGLLYRGIRKHNIPQRWKAGDSTWIERTLSTLGFDADTLAGLRHIKAHELLRIAPWLLAFPRGAKCVEVALNELVAAQLPGVSIELREFCGSWSPLSLSQYVRLGEHNSTLGVDLIAGDEVAHLAGTIELRIGPLSDDAFSRFGRDGDLQAKLAELLGLLLDRPVDVSLHLFSDTGTHPPMALGAADLGVDSWLGQAESGRHIHRDLDLFADESATAGGSQ